jgi:hypothetical protein
MLRCHSTLRDLPYPQASLNLIPFLGDLPSIIMEGEGNAQELVEYLIQRLLQGSHQEWVATFKRVVQELGGIGGEVGLMTEYANPRLLISYGEKTDTTSREDLVDFFCQFWGMTSEVGKIHSVVLGGHKPFACCSLMQSESEVLGVVVWGDSGTRFDDLFILRVLVLLLSYAIRNQTVTRELADKTVVPAKRLPQGYVMGHSERSIHLHKEIESISDADIPVWSWARLA